MDKRYFNILVLISETNYKAYANMIVKFIPIFN